LLPFILLTQKIIYMKNTEKAKDTFNRKLGELQQDAQPSHIGQNLKEIVIYEKLLEMQEQMSHIEKLLDKK
jgi:hypothetical protein